MNPSSYPDLASIDGQSINIPTLEAGVAAAIDRAVAGRGFRFFTLNLDHVVKRRDDPAFRTAYASAEFISADGAPVAVLARRQAPQVRRTTGADLVRPLCREAARRGVPIAFFGSNTETLEKSARALVSEFPGLVIAHREAPPYGFDPTSPMAEEAIKRIGESGARIVFVALGAPKQELLAAHAARYAPELGFVCIGAALDFLAGTQKRAPLIFQRTGFEWLWRLGTNPTRLAKRYALCAGVLAQLLMKTPGNLPRRMMTRTTPQG